MLQRSASENSRLTVLHLAAPVDGGVARVVTELVRAQVAEGFRTIVACPPGGELASDVAAAGARVHTWSPVRAPGPRSVRMILTAVRIIRRSSPHLVHAHSARAGLAARLTVRGRVPTVFQPHAWSFEATEGRAAELALKWERYGTRWTTRTLCVSETERRAGEQAGIAARWAVIRNGIDLRHFSADDETGSASARSALPQLNHLPAAAPLVVCVARLCRQKGQDILLRAWPRVSAAVTDARLVLVGDGPDRAQLTRLAPPGVLFAGAYRDTRPWYRAADVAVLPSRWEGMALAPLEAMACGLPVVVTDVGGARESLPPGHEAFGLVPPEDPAALAAALVTLLTGPELRQSLGRQAQAHTRATRDVRHTAAAVCGLYQELLQHVPLGPPRPAGKRTP